MAGGQDKRGVVAQDEPANPQQGTVQRNTQGSSQIRVSAHHSLFENPQTRLHPLLVEDIPEARRSVYVIGDPRLHYERAAPIDASDQPVLR